MNAYEELKLTIKYSVCALNTSLDRDVLAHYLKMALNKKPRNCDIGTASDQQKLFEQYCHYHEDPINGCLHCPLHGQGSCELSWAQLPYEPKKGGKQ